MTTDPGASTTADPGERPDARSRLAMEQTLLAWVRTGLALMGFGFVLSRFGLFLQQLATLGHTSDRQVHASLWFGIVLIILGVLANLTAAAMHYPFLKSARGGETDLPATWRLALLLGLLTSVAGIVMTALLIFMEWGIN